MGLFEYLRSIKMRLFYHRIHLKTWEVLEWVYFITGLLEMGLFNDQTLEITTWEVLE